jgi:hypothetical protein
MVEVFEPAPMRKWPSENYFTTGVYRQTVRLGVKPLENLVYLMLQRQFSDLNGRKLDHCPSLRLLHFYVWLRLLLNCENVHSHDFL